MRPADFMQLFSDPMGFCMCSLYVAVPLIIIGFLRDLLGSPISTVM